MLRSIGELFVRRQKNLGGWVKINMESVWGTILTEKQTLIKRETHGGALHTERRKGTHPIRRD